MKRRPVMVDLFCGAGGCSVGYHRAGFDVVGVDIKPQPHYPFRFVQDDALHWLRDRWTNYRHDGSGFNFCAIHASPPCQKFSQAQRLQGRKHPDLLTPILELLPSFDCPWVVENVVGAPMPNPIVLCGSAFGIGVRRHRLFSASFDLKSPGCKHELQKDYVGPFGHCVYGWVTVFGGGAAKNKKDGRRRATAQEAKNGMGIDWMNRDEMSQAIPPAYTEFIGQQLLKEIA